MDLSAPRSAVVDLGSNSVRLVVFEGLGRTPATIFNERAVLRLGRGMQASGQLNAAAIEQALLVMERFCLIARAMQADPFEVLATAAVRDASNGPAFTAELGRRMPGVPIRILPGDTEAALSAEGLLCGIPEADGIMADIGGGSMEVVRLRRGERIASRSLRLGVIRLADRANGDVQRARDLAEADLNGVPFLVEGSGRDLYLVGGAWRALARMHMAMTNYPLTIVHHYTIDRDAARDFAGQIVAASRRMLERMPGVPRRRVDDVPFAAVVLRRLLRATDAGRVVFSANGLREGWYMDLVPGDVRRRDPLLATGQELARQLGRDAELPPHLVTWTEPLFDGETRAQRRLREAACWLSDIGSHDHPEYRAEQAFLRILRQPGVALDHPSRAFLAMVLAVRYEAEPDAAFTRLARDLLSPEALAQATTIGLALRLAYVISAGTPGLLLRSRLVTGSDLTLQLEQERGGFMGESVSRPLERLATAMGRRAEMAAA